MSRTSTIATLFAVVISTAAHAVENGTIGVSRPDPITTGNPARPTHPNSSTVILNPIESVSISNTSVWQDNRHRAYYDFFGTDYVSGFLLFDVSSIPDGSTITSMELLCHLEDAFSSPYLNPVVDVYYSADDNWTRATATPGSLSHDVLLAGGIPFTTYVATHNFVLDVSAHTWAGDLLDDRIAIGFKNANNFYSYVYFYGAGGDPTGPNPTLTIRYDGPTSVGRGTWGRLKALYK